MLKLKRASRRTLRKWLASLLVAMQVLVPAVPVAAQSGLPSLGDGVEMSTSAERKLGDQIAREIYGDPDYVDDAILGDYVQGIWSRLMAAARLRGELTPEMDERYAWQLLLIRDRTVNAFALPGGYMGVNLGLIAVVSSEDELASVLGHETSHVTQRHIARLISQQSTQTPLLLAAMILGVLAGVAGNASAAGAAIVGGTAAVAQGQLNFSRDMEREADRVGYGVMTQAGFDGRGFVTMFEKLQQANRFNDTGDFPYLRSHPLTTERIADMQARQQLQPAAPEKPPSMTHYMMSARARMLAQPEVDKLRSALAQADSPALASVGPAQQAALMYAAVMAARGLREFDVARRWQERLQARTAGDEMAAYEARLLGAELALGTGDVARAHELLATPAPSGAVTHSTPGAASSSVPSASTQPRALLLLRASAGLQSAQARDVAETLQIWLADHPRDAQAWQLLAAACTAQGLRLRALRAEAEVKAAHLDYPAARDRLRAAQELARQSGAGVDNFEASIIDARSREIESMLREQSLQR